MQARQAYITVGLPACGKSTWARSRGLYRIERDIIRASILKRLKRSGVEFSWSVWETSLEGLVTALWHKQLQKALSRKQFFAVTDTNLNTEKRKALAARIASCGYGVTYVFFDVDVEECRRRNAQRGRWAVPDVAYARMLPRFLEARQNLQAEAQAHGYGFCVASGFSGRT